MPAELSVDRVARRRDAGVLSLVGAGHFFSHFYGIALPPLFPLLQADLSVSYAALGLVLTLPNLATMVFQTPVGFLVDRFGARPLLVLGLGLMSGAVLAAGLVSTYGALLALMALVGVGNSVVHPADYAILAARIDPRRLGRAFSLHTFAGNVGWAVAPATVVFLAAVWDWRTALAIAGLCGLAVTLLMLVRGRALEVRRDGSAARNTTVAGAPARQSGAAPRAGPSGLRLLISAPMLLFFFYMVFSSVASGGLNGFTVAVLVGSQGSSLAMANAALTALLVAGALGVLLGGRLADRTRRHDLVITTGFALAAAVLVVVGLGAPPLAMVVAAMAFVGLARGSIRPSRDMMVQAIAPAGSVGAVFGFVTTGMNVGGALAPVFFGWLIDRGLGAWVFVLAALAMLIALAFALLADRRARRA